MTRRPGTDVIQVDADGLAAVVGRHLESGYRAALVAGHEDPDGFRVVYALVRPGDDRRTEVVLHTPMHAAAVPTLAGIDYTIGRFERELRDL